MFYCTFVCQERICLLTMDLVGVYINEEARVDSAVPVKSRGRAVTVDCRLVESRVGRVVTVDYRLMESRVDSAVTWVDSLVTRVDSAVTRVDSAVTRVDSVVTRVDCVVAVICRLVEIQVETRLCLVAIRCRWGRLGRRLAHHRLVKLLLLNHFQRQCKW